MLTSSRHLVFHAAIVLLFGLPLGATLMLATAAVLGAMPVSDAVRWLVAVPMVVSAYGFCVATPLAAITGERGLQSGAPGWGRLVYGANVVGAAGSVLSAAAFLYAAAVSL